MATKRIKDLTSTATAADLLSGRYGVLDTPDITKRLPGNLLGGGGGGVLSVIIERSIEETDADFKITNGVTREQLDNAVNEGTPIKATIKRGSNTYVTSLFTLSGTPCYFVVWLHTWQTTPSLRAIAIDIDSKCHWVSSNFTTPSGWEPPYTDA